MRKFAGYLPFAGIVLFVCATSWAAGRTRPDGLWHTADLPRRTISR
ncbi:hypothetical protein [Nonomuraea sp. MG754425]|nr:hypothetical protein [Nonomuraea sp. MG754425]